MYRMVLLSSAAARRGCKFQTYQMSAWVVWRRLKRACLAGAAHPHQERLRAHRQWRAARFSCCLLFHFERATAAADNADVLSLFTAMILPDRAARNPDTHKNAARHTPTMMCMITA